MDETHEASEHDLVGRRCSRDTHDCWSGEGPRNELWNNTCVYVLQKPGQYCVRAWVSICEQRWTRAVSPRQWEIGCRDVQRVPVVADQDTRKLGVDSIMPNAATVARQYISEQSAGNVRNLLAESSPSKQQWQEFWQRQCEPWKHSQVLLLWTGWSSTT